MGGMRWLKGGGMGVLGYQAKRSSSNFAFLSDRYSQDSQLLHRHSSR